MCVGHFIIIIIIIYLTGFFYCFFPHSLVCSALHRNSLTELPDELFAGATNTLVAVTFNQNNLSRIPLAVSNFPLLGSMFVDYEK